MLYLFRLEVCEMKLMHSVTDLTGKIFSFHQPITHCYRGVWEKKEFMTSEEMIHECHCTLNYLSLFHRKKKRKEIFVT